MSHLRRQEERAPVSLYVSFPFSCHCQKWSFGNRLLTASCHEDNSDTVGIILTAPLLFPTTEVGSFHWFWSRRAAKGTLLPKPGQAVKLMGSFGTWKFLFILSFLPKNQRGPCLCVTLVKTCCSNMCFCHQMSTKVKQKKSWLLLPMQFSSLFLLLLAWQHTYLPPMVPRSSK